MQVATSCMPDLTEALEGSNFIECDRDGEPLLVKGQGFANPFTQISNLILGNEGKPGLMAYLNGAELKLYLAICRFTIGYQNRRYWQASHETAATMSGIKRKAVMTAAKSLSSDDKKLISHSRTRGVTMWEVHPENIPAFLLKMSQKDSIVSEAECIKKTQSTSQNDSMDESKRLNQRVKMTRPSKKENINKVEIKNKRNSAPKNGAAERGENPLTDSPQNQSSEVNVDSGAVNAPPSCENPPPADKPRSAKQLEQDTWLNLIAQAVGCFTPASETSDGKNSYHGKASRIGKEIKELKNLKVDLAELERMVIWFEQVNYRGKRAEKPKITDFLGELAQFRAYEQALVAIADPARASAIDAIKAVCVPPQGGWETVAERLNKAADWFIEHGYADKISGFATYWQEIKATAAPDLDTLYRNWNKYLSSLEGNHGANNNTPVYSKNSSRIHGRRGIEGDTPRVVCTITSDQLFA